MRHLSMGRRSWRRRDETCFGCAAAMYLGGAGLDNALAGANTFMNCQPMTTVGQPGCRRQKHRPRQPHYARRTMVTATNQLSLISGNDTTLQGAQAKGNTVLASVGGNLNIASDAPRF
jgi:hypothetical protein